MSSLEAQKIVDIIRDHQTCPHCLCDTLADFVVEFPYWAEIVAMGEYGNAIMDEARERGWEYPETKEEE